MKTKNTYINPSAHRVSFVASGGTIPEGFYVAHECNNKRCQRHLYLATPKQNTIDAIRDGLYKKQGTHCPHGHEFTQKNSRPTKGTHLKCKECDRIRQAQRRARLRVEHPERYLPRTTCKLGHPLSKYGKQRRCRTCLRKYDRESKREHWAKNLEESRRRKREYTSKNRDRINLQQNERYRRMKNEKNKHRFSSQTTTA